MTDLLSNVSSNVSTISYALDLLLDIKLRARELNSEIDDLLLENSESNTAKIQRRKNELNTLEFFRKKIVQALKEIE